MSRQSMLNDVRATLESLKFDADEGAYAAAEEVFVEIIPVREANPETVTLRIRVGLRGLPASGSELAYAVAQEISEEMVRGNDPIAQQAAAATLKRLRLPRSKPSAIASLANIPLRLVDPSGKPLRTFECETGVNGVCKLSGVLIDGQFGLALADYALDEGSDNSAARQAQLAGAGEFQSKGADADARSSRVGLELPDSQLRAYISRTDDGSAQLTIESENIAYNGAIVQLRLGDQSCRLTLAFKGYVFAAHVTVSGRFAEVSGLRAENVHIEMKQKPEKDHE